MKKIVIAVFTAFALNISLYAQEISDEEWLNISRHKRKEIKREQRLEQLERIMDLLESRAWVLEANILQNRYGYTVNIEPNINFVGVSGEESTVQLGSTQRMGLNGLGGITLEGNIIQYELVENKKSGTGATLQISVSGASSGHLSMLIHASPDGTASATVSDNFGNRLTYRGRIVPLSESIVYKGQVVY